MPRPCLGNSSSQREQSGFTLIELMIAITISLLIMIAMAIVLLNITRTNSEMAKTNSQIENGRFAIQLLQSDLEHAGFWGAYIPQFDDLTSTATPSTATAGGTVPDAVPDPCLAYSTGNWNTTYKANLIGVPVQPVPSGDCTGVVSHQQSSTDIVVVRHAATCVAGSSAATGDCEAADANKLYFQASLCSATAQLGSTSTTIKLAANSSSNSASYVGTTIRLVSGTGGGQSRTITAYDGATKIATISPAWSKIPDASTNYSFDTVDYLLNTYGTGSTLTLHKRDCSTTADIRKFISNIYYIRDYSIAPGDGIPTLVRSQFDLSPDGTTLEHQPPEAMVEGIEGFQIEYGIDNLSKTGVNIITDTTAANRYDAALQWQDPADQRTAVNRGDGNADTFSHCTPASPCTFQELTNVVAVKLYVLARSRETSPGYLDDKTYTLGTATLGPFNDGYKRHVFSTTIRLINVSGRKETPWG